VEADRVKKCARSPERRTVETIRACVQIQRTRAPVFSFYILPKGVDVNNSFKEVAFALYCPKCEYKELEGYKSPCNECLEVPARPGTNVPEEYKEDKNGR